MAKKNEFDLIESELNDKQKLFCHKYIELNFEKQNAAIAAGYGKNCAAQQANWLLNHPQVIEYIEAVKKDLGRRLGITRERIANELAKIAFFDVKKIYNEDGELVLIHELDEDTAGAISGVEVMGLMTKKVKIYDKTKALDSLNKMLGYNAPETFAQTTVDGNDIIEITKPESI